jgi:hypothetical protein
VLALSWDTVRLFLHVLAATVWVGGQLTLAALVPALRRFGADVVGTAARRFNQVAWAAFGVLIATGIWSTPAGTPGRWRPGPDILGFTPSSTLGSRRRAR